MEEKKKNTLGRSILKALKNRLKPRHILFLAIIISANAFAWFIYMDKISSDLDVRVKSWNVSFTLNNQQMSDYINFTVNDIYPGMTTYNQTLSVTNDGEVAANLTYEIVSLNVFGSLYTTENGDYTEAQLVNMMNNNYPFRITVSTNQGVIYANGGTASFVISVAWPYESINGLGESNDTLDTYWGNQAYTFKANNPNSPCIQVRIKLSAVQVPS